jgi:hypothetical protein
MEAAAEAPMQGNPEADELARSWELVEEERRKANAMKQQLMQLLQGKGRDVAQDQEASTSGRNDLVVRSPWMSWLLAGTTASVLALQWGPLLPQLLSSLRHLDLEALLAFALVVPDSPAAAAWQMVGPSLAGYRLQPRSAALTTQCALPSLQDPISVVTGHWGCVLKSCFVHSGLLAGLLGVASLLQSGALIEESLGPLVLLVHVVMCGVGAALAQLALQPVSAAIAGPGE